MKKAYLSVALALVAAGSWAFYPKADEPRGYMMVASHFDATGINAKISVSVISPDGQVTDAKLDLTNKIAGSFDQLRASELKKLNELRKKGWNLVSSTQMNAREGRTVETIYVLEKQ